MGSKGGVRVLFVDDEQVVRDATSALLEALGYEADVASDGFDGLCKLRKKDYHVAIVDRSMPEMDGFEMIRQVRGEFPNVFTVLISGRSIEKDCPYCEAPHIRLTKPLRCDQLEAVMSEIEHSSA